MKPAGECASPKTAWKIWVNSLITKSFVEKAGKDDEICRETYLSR